MILVAPAAAAAAAAAVDSLFQCAHIRMQDYDSERKLRAEAPNQVMWGTLAELLPPTQGGTRSSSTAAATAQSRL